MSAFMAFPTSGYSSHVFSSVHLAIFRWSMTLIFGTCSCSRSEICCAKSRPTFELAYCERCHRAADHRHLLALQFREIGVDVRPLEQVHRGEQQLLAADGRQQPRSATSP